MKKHLVYLLMLSFGSFIGPSELSSQDCYLGEIRQFAGTYVPNGWAECDGSLLSISENRPLYALLESRYGGDDSTTFGLPDLRGRVAIGRNSNNKRGSKLGEKDYFLTIDNTPKFEIPVTSNSGEVTKGRTSMLSAAADSNTGEEHPQTYNQPVENSQSSIALRYIICVKGIFPSRS